MKTAVLQIRLTDEDKERIETLASHSSFGSVSEYVRGRALNHKIESRFDADFMLELIKVNADIARLGNLLRLSLKDNNKYSAEQLKLIESNLVATSSRLKDMVLA
ncbi:plasmid mobilization protein [Scandinavium goeteborgense]|uniref:plasmid mobilization protein n=1 Tax=Scandinavium goeteborgense TaxID=1851514 RepID=UPI0037FA200A